MVQTYRASLIITVAWFDWFILLNNIINTSNWASSCFSCLARILCCSVVSICACRKSFCWRLFSLCCWSSWLWRSSLASLSLSHIWMYSLFSSCCILCTSSLVLIWAARSVQTSSCLRLTCTARSSSLCSLKHRKMEHLIVWIQIHVRPTTNNTVFYLKSWSSFSATSLCLSLSLLSRRVLALSSILACLSNTVSFFASISLKNSCSSDSSSSRSLSKRVRQSHYTIQWDDFLIIYEVIPFKPFPPFINVHLVLLSCFLQMSTNSGRHHPALCVPFPSHSHITGALILGKLQHVILYGLLFPPPQKEVIYVFG